MIGDFLISTAHASETAGAPHHEGPIYLQVEFWVGLAFVLVVLAIVKISYQKICAMLDARGATIQNRLESARRIREEAQALLAEYQRKQRDAMQESQDILNRARNEAVKLKAQAAKELEERVAAAERQAIERIKLAEEQAKREVRDIAVDVAIASATRVMGEKLSATQADALIDRAISELPKKMH